MVCIESAGMMVERMVGGRGILTWKGCGPEGVDVVGWQQRRWSTSGS